VSNNDYLQKSSERDASSLQASTDCRRLKWRRISLCVHWHATVNCQRWSGLDMAQQSVPSTSSGSSPIICLEWADNRFDIGLTFDLIRSTFDEMREKRFLHFRSQWPWPLTLIRHVCSPSYSCLGLYIYGCLISSEWMALDGVTDRQTDGQVQHLLQSSRDRAA